MKRRLLLTATALSLPCCNISCAAFPKEAVIRTLKAAGVAALQGAIPAATGEIRLIQAEKAAKSAKQPQNVQP